MRAFTFLTACAVLAVGGPVAAADTAPAHAPTLGTSNGAAVTRLDRATQRISVPEGYKVAWTDGRHNVNRGVGTMRGDVQMRRTWTESVPQQLVDDLR